MSSDKAVVDDSEDEVSAGSDSDHPTTDRTTKKKKLIKHKLSWRSREMELTMSSLDQKVNRHCTPRVQTVFRSSRRKGVNLTQAGQHPKMGRRAVY